MSVDNTGGAPSAAVATPAIPEVAVAEPAITTTIEVPEGANAEVAKAAPAEAPVDTGALQAEAEALDKEIAAHQADIKAKTARRDALRERIWAAASQAPAISQSDQLALVSDVLSRAGAFDRNANVLRRLQGDIQSLSQRVGKPTAGK
jgi:hypothetical protein